MPRTSSSLRMRYSLPSSLTSEPEYFPTSTLSPTLTSERNFFPVLQGSTGADGDDFSRHGFFLGSVRDNDGADFLFLGFVESFDDDVVLDRFDLHLLYIPP